MFVVRSVKDQFIFIIISFYVLFCCSERKNPINLQIPHAVRDQLAKLMNSHPVFSDCAGTTAAFVVQTCK